MQQLTRKSAARGFTLVELLVVIGIIAVLISILLPVLNKAREQAKAVMCMSNEKQCMNAFMMYIADHKGATPFFPPINMTFPQTTPYKKSLGFYMDPTDGGDSKIRYDVGSFWPYLANSLHYTGTPVPGKPNTVPPQVLYRVYNCPSDTEFRTVRWGSVMRQASFDRNFSYSWNAILWAPPAKPLDNNNPGQQGPWASKEKSVSKISQIIEPSHKIVLDEERSPNDGWCFIGFDDLDDTPGNRHNGRANYGFADGHVESFAPEDIGYNKVFKASDFPTITNHVTTAYYFHLQSNHQ